MPYPIPQVNLHLLDMRTDQLKQLHTLLACIATYLEPYKGESYDDIMPICRAADNVSTEQPELGDMAKYLKDAINEALGEFCLYSTWLVAKQQGLDYADACDELVSKAEDEEYDPWTEAMNGRRYWVAELTAAVGARL
jgi:hypothetical protein